MLLKQELHRKRVVALATVVGVHLAGLIVPSSIYAQCHNWVQRPNTLQPPGRFIEHPMFFDTTTNCIIAYGRSAYGPNPQAITWLYAGSGWLKSTPQVQPPMRVDFAVAFDTNRRAGVLFGGVGETSAGGDTWEWSNFNWTQKSNSGPPPRRNHAMAFDAARGVVVLFGGAPTTAGALFGDTWEWDGQTWTQRNINGPPARYLQRMTYDAARGVIVLYGGTGEGVPWGELWEYDGAQWVQRNPSDPKPPQVYANSFAYDALRRVCVLYGLDSNTTVWEWDGTIWHAQTSTVAPSYTASLGSMAYDSHRNKMVLVSDETWEYPTNAAVQITQHPVSKTVCLGGTVSFTVQVAGDGPFTYQWRKGGGIYNAPDATMQTINISSADFGSAGEYEVVVSNGCSEETSACATLAVCPGPAGCPSPVDVNGDGAVNGLDLQRIVQVLLGG